MTFLCIFAVVLQTLSLNWLSQTSNGSIKWCFFFLYLRFSWTTGPCTATSSSYSYRRGLFWIQSIWAIQGSAAGEAWHWSATTYCQWISGKISLRIQYYLCVKFPDKLSNSCKTLPLQMHCMPHSQPLSPHSDLSTVGRVPWTMQTKVSWNCANWYQADQNSFSNSEAIFCDCWDTDGMAVLNVSGYWDTLWSPCSKVCGLTNLFILC